MTAVRQQIYNDIMGRLAAIESVAEIELMPSADPLVFPALHVFDPGQSQQETNATGQMVGMTPTIEGYVEGGGGAEAFAALNALYVETVRALITEPPLGGLAETIDEGDARVFVADLASERRLGFSLDLPITFSTRRGDPAQPA